MTNSAILDRHVLLAIRRSLVPAHLPVSQRIEQFALRAFSSSVSRYLNTRTSISFGPETDAALSPLLDNLRKRNLRRGRSTGNIETEIPSENASNLLDEGDRQLSGRKNGRRHRLEEAMTTNSDTRVNKPTQDGYNESATEEHDLFVSSKGSTTSQAPKPTDSTAVSKTSRDNSRSYATDILRRKHKASNHSLPQPTPQARYPKEQWQLQKEALTKKFKGETWNPRKKLSPDAIEGLRDLHAEDPDKYDTPTLAQAFKISPEAVRRILKSKWKPNSEEMDERRARWAKRHDRIWDQQSELGLRPPRQKDKNIEDPEEFDQKLARKETLREI